MRKDINSEAKRNGLCSFGIGGLSEMEQALQLGVAGRVTLLAC